MNTEKVNKIKGISVKYELGYVLNWNIAILQTVYELKVNSYF